MQAVAKLLLGERLPDFDSTGEADLSYTAPEIGRFRVNVFRQRGTVSVAFRHVETDIPGFAELGLPTEQLSKLAAQSSGVVLVTGVTGSGKSTTLAAMVDYMNRNFRRHIVTIEDPIEFVHTDRKCLIEQREIGIDTESFGSALKHVVRQSPDVILIGEMRDRETIETALNAAEIGHLVLSTLHTSNTMQTLERIIAYFPPHLHELIRTQIATTLQGILSQKLLTRADGNGRVPTVEVMMRTPTICEVIQRNQADRLRQAMREDTYYGCQTFNEELLRMHRAGVIDLEVALAASDRAQELKNEIQGLSLTKK
jgi:twitching motility protein PilT